MTANQFTQLSELVEDIKATKDTTIAAIACRALNDLLRYDLAVHNEDIDG